MEELKCYWCGTTENVKNNEHCPPVCIYPQINRAEKIGNLNIIPSCKKHNNDQSVIDSNLEYYVKITAHEHGKINDKDMKEVIDRSKKNSDSVFKDSNSISIEDKGTLIKKGHNINFKNPGLTIEKISRGILYDEKNILCNELILYYMENNIYESEFYNKNENNILKHKNIFDVIELLPWKDSTKIKYNNNKKYFDYKYYVSDEYLFVKLNFYENSLILKGMFSTL